MGVGRGSVQKVLFACFYVHTCVCLFLSWMEGSGSSEIVKSVKDVVNCEICIENELEDSK